MTMPHVELHIDELVLHGFSPHDRDRIGKAVEAELSLLFAEQGLPLSIAQSGDRLSVDGRTFQIGQDAKPQTIGAQVAQAVYRGFGQ